MTVSQRDKRALTALAVVGVAVGLYYFLSRPADTSSTPAYTPETIQITEQRLAIKRQLSESVPKREDALATVKASLVKREAGLIQADTAAQAQAQLLAIVKRIGRKQQPPLEMRGQEIGQIRPFGEYYGQVLVTVSFECQVNQMVNLLSDLTAQPELIASQDMRVGQARPKEKTFPVSLTVAGLVSRKLVPEKKSGQGVMAF